MADRAKKLNNAEVESNSDGNEKLYSCKLCDLQFSSYQALGGHQNAHKTERAGQLHAHQALKSQHYNARIISQPRKSVPYLINGNPMLNDNNKLRSKIPNQPLVNPNHGYNQNMTQSMMESKSVFRLFGVSICPVFTDEGMFQKLCSEKRKCMEEEASEESLKQHIAGSSSAKKQKSQTETCKHIHQAEVDGLMKLKKDNCHQYDKEFFERKMKFDSRFDFFINEDNKDVQEKGKKEEVNEEIIQRKKNTCSLIDGSLSNEIQKNFYENGKDSLYNKDGDMKSIGKIDGPSSAILIQKDAPNDKMDCEANLKWMENLHLRMDGSSSRKNREIIYDHNSFKKDKGEVLDLDLHL